MKSQLDEGRRLPKAGEGVQGDLRSRAGAGERKPIAAASKPTTCRR